MQLSEKDGSGKQAQRTTAGALLFGTAPWRGAICLADSHASAAHLRMCLRPNSAWAKKHDCSRSVDRTVAYQRWCRPCLSATLLKGVPGHDLSSTPTIAIRTRPNHQQFMLVCSSGRPCPGLPELLAPPAGALRSDPPARGRTSCAQTGPSPGRPC